MLNLSFISLGNNYLHVVDFSATSSPRIVHAEKLSTIANDIEICIPGNGRPTIVGVAMEGSHPSRKGQVVLYQTYSGNGMNDIHKITG